MESFSPFLQPLKMHCRDCALVTSSGHLLRSHQGPQIDKTECVIRMNDAPTRGYGRDVGNRTSLRVIAHSSIQRILRNRHDLLNVSQGTVFIFWGPSSYMRRDGKGQVYNNLQLLSQVLPRLKAFMITRHKMLQFDELFKRETGKDRYQASGVGGGAGEQVAGVRKREGQCPCLSPEVSFAFNFVTLFLIEVYS